VHGETARQRIEHAFGAQQDDGALPRFVDALPGWA
jgi:hypothetical protein